MFLYMLAGLALATTNIGGQQAVLQTCPNAGFLYEPGDHVSLARQLQTFLSNRSSLMQAREASLEAARTRWNWETESVKLVEKVAGIVSAGSVDRVQSARNLYTSSTATL
jgi:glycosyltransferase involved in cell wall biosynthesis